MIRVNVDYPVNALDDMYTSTKKTIQDIVTCSYDDIDNVIPNDVVDIDFTPNNDGSKSKTDPAWFNQFTEKIKNFFSK
ncbi:MAG: hypothetical protein NC191_05860 [Muribaculaceae bacterium]|nr:hypothetical protein [Muribaculaceae bacterium]